MKPVARRWLLVVLAVTLSLPWSEAREARAGIVRPHGLWRHPRTRWRHAAADRTVQSLLAAEQQNLDNHDPATAERQFSAVLRIEPCNVAALARRSVARTQLGRTDDALADSETAIRLASGSSDAYLARAGVYAAKHDFVRAIADCNEAIRLNAKNEYAYYWRGCANDASHDSEKAIQDLELRH